MPIVTLLTDFGESDTYVGQVRGALLGVCPSATIVDLTHAVPPQDVFAGAFLLWTAVEALPARAVHLAVVDPGVGSPRRAIAIRARRGDVLVGPDNGLLWPATQRLGGCAQAVTMPRPERASSTFHGRDVFAPAAGRAARGEPLASLGTPLIDPVTLELPSPRGDVGEILHVDTYGNLVTNFAAADLPPAYVVRVAGRVIGHAAYYAAVPPGALLAIVGSAGLLEISARDASAAQVLGARRGTAVTVEAA